MQGPDAASKRRWSPQQWFSEFKRRRVFRVFGAYAVVVFGLLPVADIVVKALHLPEWTLTLLVVLAGVGLPLALVLGWVFDLTPQGVIRTAHADGVTDHEVAAAFPSRAIGRVVIGTIVGAIFGIGAVGAYLYVQPRERPNRVTRVSIAVLPFQNLAADGTNDFLRLSLPDEIAAVLSYTPSLVLRPFASTRKYAAADFDPQTAGRELRVERVVTGHYSSLPDGLRITLEVIEVGGNRVLWRDSVSVPPKNLLAMREQITSRVRRGLLPTLGFSNLSTPTAARPSNAVAYDLYLHSLAVSRDAGPNKQAIAMLERVVSLDSGYARPGRNWHTATTMTVSIATEAKLLFGVPRLQRCGPSPQTQTWLTPPNGSVCSGSRPEN
jgi:TolB-like protein